MMNQLLRNPRFSFLATLFACCGLLAFGLYLQHVENIEPCPLCILQRYAFVLIALLALIFSVWNPHSLMRKLAHSLIGLSAIAGGGVSIRQIWLQHNPPQVSTCGPDLNYMISKFPLSDVLPKLFHGEGDCAKIDWTFLSLSIAEWALICFSAMLIFNLWQGFRRR